MRIKIILDSETQYSRNYRHFNKSTRQRTRNFQDGLCNFCAFQCFSNFKAKINQIVSSNVSFERAEKLHRTTTSQFLSYIAFLRRNLPLKIFFQKISVFQRLFLRKFFKFFKYFSFQLFSSEQKIQLHALIENLILYKNHISFKFLNGEQQMKK